MSGIETSFTGGVFATGEFFICNRNLRSYMIREPSERHKQIFCIFSFCQVTYNIAKLGCVHVHISTVLMKLTTRSGREHRSARCCAIAVRKFTCIFHDNLSARYIQPATCLPFIAWLCAHFYVTTQSTDFYYLLLCAWLTFIIADEATYVLRAVFYLRVCLYLVIPP